MLICDADELDPAIISRPDNQRIFKSEKSSACWRFNPCGLSQSDSSPQLYCLTCKVQSNHSFRPFPKSFGRGSVMTDLHAHLVGLVSLGKGLLQRLYDVELWRISLENDENKSATRLPSPFSPHILRAHKPHLKYATFLIPNTLVLMSKCLASTQSTFLLIRRPHTSPFSIITMQITGVDIYRANAGKIVEEFLPWFQVQDP